MSKKNSRILSIIIIIILIITAATIAYLKFGKGRNEIKVAKKFIEKLNNNDIINRCDISNLEFDVKEKKLESESNESVYSIDNDIFTINLDSKDNVISFVEKSNNKNEIKSITEEKAIELSKKYVKELCGDDYRYKSIVEETLKNSIPYYSITFSKYEDGYPYFSTEIQMNINKFNGKMQGYFNNSKHLKHKNVFINVSKEEAEKEALALFNELYKDGKINNDPFLAFCEWKGKKNNIELSYVIEVTGKGESGDEIKYIYFVSSDTGKVINSFSTLITKTEVK